MTPVQLPEVPAPVSGTNALIGGYTVWVAPASNYYTPAQLREYATAAAETYLRALIDLLEDTQHKDHNCGDTPENCPVLRARLLITPSETNSG